MIFGVAPTIALCSIGLTVIISSKVKGFKEAQQISVVLRASSSGIGVCAGLWGYGLDQLSTGRTDWCACDRGCSSVLCRCEDFPKGRNPIQTIIVASQYACYFGFLSENYISIFKYSGKAQHEQPLLLQT